MSTRSRIAIMNDDKTIKSVYCHSDGYLSWNGKILLQHYQDEDKIKALINLGDLSSLSESIECPKGHSFDNRVEGYTIAYMRDRGEINCNGINDVSLDQLIKTGNDSDAEYIYIYKDKKWYWHAMNYHGKQWFELTEECI